MMIFSLQNKLILSSLFISACRAQDDSDSTTPAPRLISNQNSAALTAGALGLGIGVAGSLIVSKLIDDAAKCKQSVPPAISKLFPLPDLLKFNPVNPDCNKKFSQTNNYRETQSSQYPSQYPTQYPTQYPSQGYDVVPLSTFSQSSYQPAPVDLNPTFSYSQSSTTTTSTTAPVKLSSGFSQTSAYNPQPNPARPSYPSPSPSQPEVSYVPNPAIQPRGLTDLFSPVAAPVQSSQFTQTEAVVPQVDSFRSGRAQESGEALFQPLTREELNKKTIAHSGFTQTEAVVPEVDSFRAGKALEDQPVLFQPVAKKELNKKIITESGFTQTEAVIPGVDSLRAGKALEDQPVLFQPVATKEMNKKIIADSGFSQTEAVVPEVDSFRTGKTLEDQPVLFQPVVKKQSNQKAPSSPGFSQTEAVTPSTDHFRNGKSVNSDVVIEGREIERFNPGFSETEAILPEPDEVRTGKQLNTKTGLRPVLFRPLAQDKLPRRGKTLTEAKSEPKPFTVSHPVSAVADLSSSDPELHISRPHTFSVGL